MKNISEIDVMVTETANSHKVFISDGLEDEIIVFNRYLMTPKNHRIGNEDEITKASDVFQLAAAFCFAATKRHQTGIVKSSDWPGPPKVFEVLESALSHDPQSRPQDGNDFHERIKSALEN